MPLVPYAQYGSHTRTHTHLHTHTNTHTHTHTYTHTSVLKTRRMCLQGLASSAVDSPKGAKVLVVELDGVDAKAMQEAAQKLLGSLGDPAAVVLATRGASGTQANFVAAFSPKVSGGE